MVDKTSQKLIYEFTDNALAQAVYGPQNSYLHLIEEALGIDISASGNVLKIDCRDHAEDDIEKLFAMIEELATRHKTLEKADIQAVLRFGKTSDKQNSMNDPDLTIETRKRDIMPRSPKQAEMIASVKQNNITFAVGPAGTGKTYLAVALAVDMFLRGEVERMIFARPAVEAGERLGYLPGDMEEKIAPYLRPIYDSLFDMMHGDKLEKARARGEIEIAPLAFMRGRTLSHAAVVLDEAQNTTPQQMKMFLTRFGEGSKMIVAGDPSQADLPEGMVSGLQDAIDTLSDVKGSRFIHFKNSDVVRHDMVGRILDAYDKRSKNA